MKSKVGDRVGAIQDANKTRVRLFGYGVYVGDEIPDENAGGFAVMLREAGIPNPKIKLDSGDIVWGCECWWAPEEEIKKTIGTREVMMVTKSPILLKEKEAHEGQEA